MLHLKLKALANKIRDKKLRKKVMELMENPTFEINGKQYSGLPLDVSPAGLSHHHCYPGGYVEHVVSTASLALAMCNSVEKVYHGKVNRDLTIAGVLLHDIFKPATYAVSENGSYSSTRLADYIDHLSLVISELVRRDFPLELVHIVSAHHGDYGPIRPHTVEALICHLADLMDSRLNGQVLSAATYLTRKAVGEELRGLTSKEAFEIVYSKAVEGWKGVAKTLEKIKRKREMHKT
ncbi:MAG: HDIG domain-containing protein [Candidatus Bathyarchaeota archaeon]|nr:HDIG domain-containing protein [Candidatus Bathyarchaeota archaeon]MDH5746593.1 HDIG domain-containing protein [Candidatus Bathyarchaeota archaeon]